MKVGIGADHGGFEMKQQLAKLLAAEAMRSSILATKYMTPTTTTPILRFPSPALWHVETSSAAFWCAAAA